MISAVGHEPDVTISDYVADMRAATPSNAAELAVPDQDALRQHLDRIQDTMNSGLMRQIKNARNHLTVLKNSNVLQRPDAYIIKQKETLFTLQKHLVTFQGRYVDKSKQRFISYASKLDALSPLKVLTRGYTLTQKLDGQVVRSVNQVDRGERIQVCMNDGSIEATVIDIKGDVQ